MPLNIRRKAAGGAPGIGKGVAKGGGLRVIFEDLAHGQKLIPAQLDDADRSERAPRPHFRSWRTDSTLPDGSLNQAM